MKYLVPIFLLMFLGFPLVANAQFQLCHIFTGYDLSEIGPFGQKLINLLELITSLIVLIGIGIAVIVVIIAGIKYMTAGGDQAKVTEARKALTYGLVGFAIAVGAMFILCLVAEILSNLYVV